MAPNRRAHRNKQKRHEKHLRDQRGNPDQPDKTENGGDNGEDQKKDGVLQHLVYNCWNRATKQLASFTCEEREFCPRYQPKGLILSRNMLSPASPQAHFA
jgi:hypothetical protein